MPHQTNGQRFGKYLLQDRLALGGMAEIFKGKFLGAEGFSKEIVIKRIHPEYSEDQNFVRMFTNEAKIAAKLSHPNIVQVTDFDKFNNTYYIAMEFIEGADLKRLQLRGQSIGKPLPKDLAVYIVHLALKGLHYAHHFRQGSELLEIVHRDISPHNILLSMQGEIKIADFGIARVIQHVSLTSTGTVKGKLSYMAPEQTFSSKVNQQADLFSMGVVLWELLTQKRLLKEVNQALIIEKLRHSEFKSPHQLNPEIPEALSDIVMWALERDLSKRIPNARTFLRELQAFLPTNRLLEEDLQNYMQELFGEEDKPKTDLLDSWTPPSAKETKSSSSKSSGTSALGTNQSKSQENTISQGSGPNRKIKQREDQNSGQNSISIQSSDSQQDLKSIEYQLPVLDESKEDWMLQTSTFMASSISEMLKPSEPLAQTNQEQNPSSSPKLALEQPNQVFEQAETSMVPISSDNISMIIQQQTQKESETTNQNSIVDELSTIEFNSGEFMQTTEFDSQQHPIPQLGMMSSVASLEQLYVPETQSAPQQESSSFPRTQPVPPTTQRQNLSTPTSLDQTPTQNPLPLVVFLFVGLSTLLVFFLVYQLVF